MIYAALVSTEDELDQIYALNQQNLKLRLSQEERDQEGFVTWLYSIDLLRNMHQLAPSVIVKDEDKVIGYALVALKESSAFHPDLQTMFSNLSKLNYKEKPLFSYSFYCMGQICIDKNYRGKGLVNSLYQKHRQTYSNNFELLITEISVNNKRSQKAHEKIGFKTIYTYPDTIDEWNVVVWEWERLSPT